MALVSQLLFYVPGTLAAIGGLVAAGWIYPRRRVPAWLLGVGVVLQVLASGLSAGISAWLLLSLDAAEFSSSNFAFVSAAVGATSSVLHAVSIALLVAATLAAVTGWGEGEPGGEGSGEGGDASGAGGSAASGG